MKFKRVGATKQDTEGNERSPDWVGDPWHSDEFLEAQENYDKAKQQLQLWRQHDTPFARQQVEMWTEILNANRWVEPGG